MQISYSNSQVVDEQPSASGPLRVVDEHTAFIGKLAKPAPLYRALEAEYRKLFNVGLSDYNAEMLAWQCHEMEPKRQAALIFVDEPPVKKHGLIWFFLRIIGPEANGDLYLLTLDQLMLCQ
jgi:hypothetical protein